MTITRPKPAKVLQYHTVPDPFIVKGSQDWELKPTGLLAWGNSLVRYPDMPNNDLYFGVEVETESMGWNEDTETLDTDHALSPEEVAGIWKSHNMGWTMRDASLSAMWGSENVTYPHTYERLIASEIVDALTQMRELGVRAWDTSNCGLHIHMSKKAFKGREHMARFCKIHEKMPNLLRKLGGRGGVGDVPWQFALAEPGALHTTHALASDVAMGTAYDSKGSYLNVGGNAQTIECRFWKGSVNPDQVLGAVSMEKAIYEWSKILTDLSEIPREDETLDQLLNWSENNAPVEFSYIQRLCEVNTRRSMSIDKENA